MDTEIRAQKVDPGEENYAAPAGIRAHDLSIESQGQPRVWCSNHSPVYVRCIDLHAR